MRGEERIFAVGFLAAAPAWIAKDIDIGRPEIESLEEHVGAIFANGLGVLNAALSTDDFSHLVNSRRIKCGCETDGLGEFGRAAVNNAVQSLAPPVIRRDIEPGDGPGLVNELRCLFLESHAVN